MKDYTEGDFNFIPDYGRAEKQLPLLLKRIKDWDYTLPLSITLKPYRHPRTVSQNALFYVWCRVLSKRFIHKSPDCTVENMALMFKNRFLGTEDIKVGNSIIKNQVKHSSDLDVGEFVYFLDQVYHWALDINVILDIPETSEYAKLKQTQNK